MRALLAPLVVAAAVVVPPAHAADPMLVVRGTRAGYVDVTIAEPFDVDTFGFQATHQGRIGGFYAERIGAPEDSFGVIRISHGGEVANVRIAKAGAPGSNATGEPRYPAGRYRIHAVADGPFRMALPIPGVSRSIEATPRRSVAAPRLSVVEGTNVATTLWEARERFTTSGARVAAVSISFVRWTHTGAHQSLLCFAKPGAECDDDKRFVSPGQVGAGVGGNHRGADAYVALPGVLGKGSWEAFQRTTTEPGAVFKGMHGMALVFDAPAGR